MVNFLLRNLGIYWTNLHQVSSYMVDIWSWITGQIFFFRSLKGGCHGNQF